MGSLLSPGDLRVLEMPPNVWNPNTFSTLYGSKYLHRLLLRSPQNNGILGPKTESQKRHRGSFE
jgi:hypothetical protein